MTKAEKRPVPKTPHPEDMNGDSFNSSGGHNMYALIWNINERVGKLEGKVLLLLAFIPPLLMLILGTLIAGAFLK